MNGSLAEAIQVSFGFGSPDDRVHAAKQAVSDHLLQIDHKVRIHHTEYFNHSFAPDLVMTWPREKRERYVYLRPSHDLEWLAEDLRWIGANKPVVLTLEPGDSHSLQSVAVSSQASASGTLVAEPASIDQFSGQDTSFAQLLAHAVLQGGRGLLDATRANAVADKTFAGFEGAQRLATDLTREATETVAQTFDQQHATRITRILRAVWEGHGGSPSQFPAGGNLSGPLTAEDIEVLLATVDSSDPAFWRRVGAKMTLTLLTEAHVPDPCPNLGRLVTANLDRLSARALRVVVEQSSILEGLEDPWTVARGCLLLRGGDWLAYFAPKIDNLPAPREQSGLELADLMRELQGQRQRITDLRIQRPELAITFQSVMDSNVVDAQDLSDVAERGSARATAASVSLPNGRHLKIDFLTGTAGGNTTATYSLADLGRHGLPLLLLDGSATNEMISDYGFDDLGAWTDEQLSIDDLM